ncbi:hypothetical protein GCM10009037_01300 [Halarchaeum grantii]|uniref:Uncharacterized protein n=1 Tax=Halarchaeum grantii TaxID=1193105 RepID=A0A830EY63_9EURY|nr:hypothetical protein [Halarchaeum grantii]GGL21723.1 hypothetical protein GCM10009037_01300 [Halarchaeum grantii]
MERTWRLDDGERVRTITGVRRPDWQGMTDPCPDCGARAFRHVATSGGRYECVDGVVTRRTDYWDAGADLLTQCLDCDAVLYKHPAFELCVAILDGAVKW